MRTRAVYLPVAVVTCVAAAALSVPGAQSTGGVEPNQALVDKMVVASDRHAPTFPGQINNFEIYLINLDGSGEQRLTNNTAGDGFGSLSPDGKRIVFDSNRNRLAGEPLNASGLFLMNADGSDQTFLIRGGSPTWSPDSKQIAFHASASGTGEPINATPGAATADSDIFVLNVDDFREHGTPPRNLTNDPAAVDDDPDWSPDGEWITYSSHDVNQRPANADYTTAEIYTRAADGTGIPRRLTTNAEEERAPSWSHDGDRIAYMCRTGGPRFEICVTDPKGTNPTRLTTNQMPHLTPAWAPDDDRIFFHRGAPVPGTTVIRNQLWSVTSDGATEELLVPSSDPTGNTLFADVGVLRVKVAK